MSGTVPEARCSEDREKGPVSITGLGALASAEQRCTRCPLYHDATQAVPGEGPRRAPLMLVGEQPGDREDIEGRPFVEPAGRMLDRALVEVGIARDDVFITNAVKHFKHEMRGKRRLHKRPNAGEVDACRWWLDVERRLVRPQVIVALGATALRALTGRSLTIARLRGTPQEVDGTLLVATVHPSSLLRAPDAERRAAAYAAFRDDLALSRRLLGEG